MPRANRRRRDQRGLDPGLFVRESRERHAGEIWVVRQVAGREPGRRYLCPGCQQMFAGESAHVVVWPAEGLGGVTDRRHWHTTCWRARDRRPPRGAYR
ncbi:hypothetical protein [Mobilicoccus caccae]|uniref:ATP/GTP-binding protein n=1 Tax=Mobilicoccus caccae TaxID=1859295 RepID=A0ABQ6INJ1_9MICO|nr:hypothetical protein [Mobilicoccus caccae]GMA38747.1 hypothetical protein GCM10025883_07920 [Mobilicoccus caccae]